MKPLQIKGVIPPVPSPLDTHGRVDGEAVHRIVEHLVNGGCDGAFFLGSTGEFASLTLADKRSVIRNAVSATASRIPVIVCIAGTCVADSVSLARLATDLGADALVVTAPYYFDLSPRELRNYFDLLLPQLDCPTLLYNMPWLTGHNLDTDCLKAALVHPNVIGFKDSSGDLSYLCEMVKIVEEHGSSTVLVGNEFLYLEALKVGAHGVVGGGANIYPSLFRKLQDAFLAGDTSSAAIYQDRISSLGNQIFGITGTPSSVFSAVKAGLATLGLCEHFMAPPLTSCSSDQLETIGRVLKNFGGRIQIQDFDMADNC